MQKYHKSRFFDPKTVSLSQLVAAGRARATALRQSFGVVRGAKPDMADMEYWYLFIASVYFPPGSRRNMLAQRDDVCNRILRLKRDGQWPPTPRDPSLLHLFYTAFPSYPQPMPKNRFSHLIRP
ncbi:hypothetical protein SAMN02745857_03789 [Andreprevotia lacus DSM 23236]|jgi:hypothetical protein|uniref:Uncharacterized protein n=1 Tax=Andreprevotia lacus DSM 23236 TaxID=1121001 RepID=A0A1W1Y0T3_9NEIS|nr:hypothetical protein [Andreprevotia lacus]SMC29368.1 hypothetical protein SAMN02745857_03789 [Andreprevotia lacus DSM 23236]